MFSSFFRILYNRGKVNRQAEEFNNCLHLHTERETKHVKRKMKIVVPLRDGLKGRDAPRFLGSPRSEARGESWRAAPERGAERRTSDPSPSLRDTSPRRGARQDLTESHSQCARWLRNDKRGRLEEKIQIRPAGTPQLFTIHYARFTTRSPLVFFREWAIIRLSYNSRERWL